MGCVNTSSKEFKQLAKKSNISSNTLELIVHKYWLETGSEENFPSDVYIQAQLGNTKYAEGLSSVIKLWNKRYSTPIICKSLEELNRRKAEAMRFFPGSSIVHYKNAKGDYVLNIKEPVDSANYIAPDYFQTDYPSNTKKLNLNIKEDKSYDIKTAQQLFNRFNTDSTNKAFAEKVFEIANNLGLRIVFTNSLPANSLGRYTNNNTISFKRDFFERDWNNDAKAPIILHEVLHALTMYAVSPQMQGIAKPQALEEFNTEINSLFLDIQSLPELEGERGIVNVNEFIAELSNPIFRNKLKNIKTEKNLWQRIVDAVMKLFGFTPKNQYYNRAMNALDEALNAFDVDTYMIYNGMKKTLKGGYEYARDENTNASAKEVRQHVEESIVEKLPEGDNRIITKNPRLTVEEKKSLDRLKPKYRGKLIYAQAGTGKTAIADNVAIFDSDYLLGEVLGTSAATAGFFFRTMSRAQKQAFWETYRDLIKRKVEEGKTVLTANASLLDDADVVIYNQSAEQTDARVNSSDRAITNKYSALNYHEATLEHINQLQQDEKNKEYIKLDSDDYLSNHILSNNNNSLDIHGETNQQESDTRLRSGVSSLNTINNFLNEFGISVNHLSEYNNDMPLFDALNRVINVKSVDEITDGVGYAVAFMMQSDPEMQKIILAAHNLRGTYNTEIRDPRKKFQVKTPLGQMTRLLVLKDDTIREVGKQIAQQLREYFGEDINKVKPSEKNESVWKIIKRFFKKLATNIVGTVISKGKIKGIKSEARTTKEIFIKDIIEALGREDFSRIKGPMIKPGSKEGKAQRVFIEKALRENPFEEGIITKLGSKGVALAGSAAIALDGTLFRPAENPLHDIDFNAPDKSSRKFMDKVMSELFDEGTWAFSTSIPNMVDRKKSTQTYVVLNQPFVTKDVRAKGFYAKYYSPDGKYLGERIKSDLKLEPGVQGKLLDFFVGPENESEYGFHKRTLNGKEYLIADSKYALAAKILWARPKDMWDYKNFRRDNRTENLLNQLDWFDSLPEKELQTQINSIKIEHADYESLDLEAPKESDNKFVFNDGTVVDAPFKLNDQQADALNEMSDFIESDENTMTLSGYAGTGKTSIMEMLANKVRKQHRRIVFTATTNKASSVLKSKVAKSGFNASTLHKAIGISLEVNENSEYDADDLVQNIKESQIIGTGDIVVIDEASMIDEHLYETINQVANDMGLKIIYVGDEAQLAPVNEDKISKVFRNHNGKIVRLTKVERTDDNAILKEATALRNGEPLSRVSSFNDEGKGVAYVKPESKKVLSDLVKYYAPKLKENPDYFRVLAYTNAAVAKYNTAVRNTLGYTTPKPHRGEPMVGYTNWGYDWRTKTYKFVNSESYKVSRVGKDTVRTIKVGNHYEKLTVTPISLVDSFGEENSFYYVDVKSNPENKKTALIIAEEIQALWQRVRTLNRKDRGPVLREINTLEEALFVNDDVTDPTRKRNGKPVRIIKKVVDFGYALTTHKSQGSTFTHVLIDDIDISKASSNHNNFYEAVDIEGLDAEENVDFSNAEMIGEGEEIDFGFDIDELETPKSEENAITESTNSEQADTRQQLRYVGVSRATDTVTIISNNVKTEDSPLNHIPGKENSNEKETPVQEETPTIEDSNVDIQRENLRQERQKVEELETELGADERASEEVKDALKVAVVGLSFEEAIARQGSFFTEEEKEQIKKSLDGKNLQVMSVSRETDPAFFSEEVVNFLKENAKKELSDPTRVQAMEIWSKHDGLPIKDILDACKKYRVAPMVSFSITGLGGTALEGGVMKYQDMLNKVGDLIKNDTLNPVTTTIRIDPLLPGVTNMEDVKKIVATAKSFGIKKFVTSLMQSYGYTKNQWVYYGAGRKSFFDLENPKDVERLKKIDSSIADVKEIDGILTPVDTSGNRVFVKNLYSNDRKVIQGIDKAMTSEGKKYDWDKYYGRTYNGKIDFKPKQQYIDEIAKVLLELDKDPEITIQTCSFNIKGLKTSACLDPMIIERVVGTDVIRPDGTYIKDTSRKDCMCYGCHGDFFKGQNKKCYSSCAYCYAAHSGDNRLNYYNADGTLKDNPYTKTSRDSSTPPSQASEEAGMDNNTYENGNSASTLNITPTKPVDAKAKAKGIISNKFIGFADGIVGSSTGDYAKQAGDKANVGQYDDSDVVFVSIPGRRGDADVRHREQQRTIDEALRALDAGSTLITDNAAYVEESYYNEGEKKLSEALKEAGAVYSERVVDGHTLGVWNKTNPHSSPSQTAEAEQHTQNPSKVEIYAGHWTREEVEGQSDKVYLFGDNTDDRVNTHHVPISTQAVIRGLPNAIGIDTKKNRGVSADSYFTDADFDTFKTQVDYAIEKAKSSGKTIVIPEDGIGTGKAMLEKKAPRLFDYLQKELKKLQSQSLKQGEEENSQVFTPHTMELKNITEQEGDKTIYVDKKWKEEELKKLDDDLGRYNMFEEYREEVLQKIENIKNAVDKVSLPNFEFKTNRYEATLIDAEWKIPLLKELEEQLTPLVQESQTETTEEQIEIINQMDRILKAANKEELKNPVSEQKKNTQQELSDFDKIQNQFNNLLDSDAISASEIRHVAELIVNTISDDITSYQKDPSLVKKHFSTLTLRDSFDMKKASREEIVKAIGINRLIKRAQDMFDPENGNYDDIDTILQADLIGKNWDALMILAADIFAKNEGFGIERNYKEGNFKTTKNTIIDYDDPDMQKKAEQAAEGEADEQEQWQVESKTIDIVYSMSELVRRALQQCYLYNSNGNKVISKWGIPERVNARNAVNSILRWTNGSMSLEDMVTKLTTKAEQNPWLNQLIQRLSDTSGEETDFQSQFYGVFSKARQLYSIVKKDKNGYYSMIVNSHPALSEAMETITAQYKIGEHPLFQNGRVNIKYLGTKGNTGTSNEFTLHKALSQLQAIVKRLSSKEELNDGMIKEAAANITGVCRIFGFNVTEDMVTNVMNVDNIKDMTKFLKFMITDLEAGLQTQKEKGNDAYDPFEFKGANSISGTLRNFFTPITDTLEDTAISAFYDSGKMYQTYITPSFMTRLFDKFNLEGQQFEDFIMDEYGFSEWFASSEGYDSQTKRWKNWWLNKLVKDPEARKAFAHKVELNFNGHNYMRNMSDAEYALSLLSEYWSESTDTTKDMALAWYKVPMQSNKPSSDFIRFYSFRGEGYKDNITNRLYEVFLQELSRIQTVRMRNNDKNNIEPIKNFDSNGRQFNFIPELNDYLEGKEMSLLRDWYTENNPDAESSKEADMKLTSLLQDKLDGKELSENDEVKLKNLVKTAIRLITENKINTILDKWQDSGIIEAAATIKGIVPKTYKDKEAINSHLRDAVENYLWNDHYASMMILQMTITDVSFYKDAEDLQKRLAQLHAPGTRGNKFALDYAGNRVSDGKYRTFILKDFDSFKSNIIDNIAEVFDRKITRAKSEAEVKSLKALKESLVGEDGRYKKINVADAQGFSSPSSYRKKAFIFGKWSKNAEEIYEKLLKGEYTYSDLETAFQPLKPFVYTHLHKNLKVSDAPITSLPVPFQAKNAEYLLIMADAIIKSEESVGGKLSQPNILRAIYRVMEDSAYDGRTYNEDGTVKEQGTYNGKGIDTVQFESAIKSGLQGKIDIHQFANMEGGEEAAYTYMRKLIYKDAEAGVKEYTVDSYVHEASFDDYCLQQEVPEHFRGHSQAHGSQVRMIIPSDLDFYKNPNRDKTAEDNKVYYEWTEIDADGKKVQKKMRADEFKREYENTIAENISQSIDNLADELHIKSTDIRERNIALSKILQREILSSPRYGVDLLQACSVDKETGNFRIPKGDPIQSKRIEQLINSIIKNRVNNQKIAGGPIVQVSNFGTSKSLHIRFKSKDGGLLMTKEEYEEYVKQTSQTPSSQTDKFNAKYAIATKAKPKTWKEYLKENQAGIAYFEVYAPIWAKELFEKFSNVDGTIDVEAIEAVDPELLKMISYRIPTEDKYSCAPMKVVGFMPREAGDAIMLPQELTEIDDSDFDVDKRYVMRKDILIRTKSNYTIKKELIKRVRESYKKTHTEKLPEKYLLSIEAFMKAPLEERGKDKFTEWLWNNYKRIAYYTVTPTSGKTYRDNKIVDMSWAVLTNEMTADKILNPGGFDDYKKLGYSILAYKNGKEDWDALEKMDTDYLKKLSYIKKDLTYADAQVQFYHQNVAGSNLIGVFAVNKVAHAVLESDDIYINIEEICGEKPFVIGSSKFSGKMKVDPTVDTEGSMVGKNVGSGVSASADTAKEPVLDLMNINMATAGVFNSLLRLGMSKTDAALFMSQDVISRALDTFNKENLTKYKSLNTIMTEMLHKLSEKHVIKESSNINTQPLTREELIRGLKSDTHEEIDYKVLLAYQKASSIAQVIRDATYPTRFNSISNAVGPLIIDNLIMEHKIENFMLVNCKDGTHLYTFDGDPIDITDIFNNHPILQQFARTVNIAKELFKDMPTGSTGFRNLLHELPNGLADTIYRDRKLLDSLANFYNSYLLVASGFVNSGQLYRYINNFPVEFIKQKIKEAYPDNALIQAIKLKTDKNKKAFLEINLTGEDTQYKELLSSAWIDLHKANPELSTKLFMYNFFRAGINFSPKTFMALVPTYVKERLVTKLSGDSKISYTDVYRLFPSVSNEEVIDQFVRNNWNNNKLVPWRDKKDIKYEIDWTTGRLSITDKNSKKSVNGLSWMKTKETDKKTGEQITCLWKLMVNDERSAEFVKVDPLGNNGEYLEISTSHIGEAMVRTTESEVEKEVSDISEQSPVEDEANAPVENPVSEEEQVINLERFAEAIMQQRESIGKPVTREGAENIIAETKKNPKLYGAYLANVFETLGVQLDKEQATKKFEEIC